MSSYEVGDHFVDHPPLFACRKHKSFLKLNRAFIDELVAWAPDIQPQNLTDLASAYLDGDDQAFRLSEYLIPPKVTLFNPRKIQGHGALPYVIIFVDKHFFGIPSSYLRRRIFDGCQECLAENDPASDASMPDYHPPAPKAARPAPAPAPAPRPTKSVKPAPPSATGSGAVPRPQAPAAKPAPQAPTKSTTKPIPKMPGAPSYKGTTPEGGPPPPA
jgi:hypothetical protein